MAAGTAARMGQQKLLLPLGDRPILAHVLAAAGQVVWSDCVAVIGEPRQELASLCNEYRIRSVYNTARLTGQASSIRTGLKHISEQLDGIFFIPGDQPFLCRQLLQAMIERFMLAADAKSMVVPCHQGERYSPVLFGAGWRPALLKLKGDIGGRTIIRDNACRVQPVDWPDTRTFLDADTCDEYLKICEYYRQERENE